MGKVILFILFLAQASALVAQQAQPFSEKEFPASQYSISRTQRTLGAVSVEIIMAARKGKPVADQPACRAWVTVKKSGETIYYGADDMEAAGCFGHFFPDEQPLDDFIFISSYYKNFGSTTVIGKSGDVMTYTGAKIYLSPDKRYVFMSNDSSISSGVSVIDVTSKNPVLFSESVEHRLADWYVRDGKYFAEIKGEYEGDDKAAFIFDFEKYRFEEDLMDGPLREDEKLRLFNSPGKIKGCKCGR